MFHSHKTSVCAALAACIALTTVCGGLSGGRAWAQQTPPPATPPASGGSVVTSPTYKIAVDDVLTVDVVDRPELSRTIQVINDGTINYPYAGQINVVGMTIKDLQERIRKAVAKEFVNPQVVISVARRVERTYSVLGEVKVTGKKVLRNDNYRVLDAIADAGGLTGERPEFYEAQLTQARAGNVVKIDLYKLLHDNDATQNYKLEQDDVLYITAVEAANVQVQVVGQMTKTGPVIIPRSGSIVEVLQLAGPPLPNAELSAARIERAGTTIPLDLRDFYTKGVLTTTEKLQAGDRLVVPENKREVTVTGAAGRTGPITYPDDRNLTVWGVFNLTGGQTKGADLKNTKLFHKNPDGTTSTTTVDLQKMVKTGDLSGDKPVVPGDTVQFKEAAPRKGLSPFEAIGLISGLATIYTLFFRR